MISTRLGEKAAAKEADEYGLKNARAIGESIGPVYGQAAGDKFATLFVGHYSAVKAYMNAAFANNFKGNPTLKKAALDRRPTTSRRDNVVRIMFIHAAK